MKKLVFLFAMIAMNVYGQETMYTIDNVIPAKIRQGPDLNSPVIYECPSGTTVTVLEKRDDAFWKVSVRWYTGYISKHWLTTVCPAKKNKQLTDAQSNQLYYYLIGQMDVSDKSVTSLNSYICIANDVICFFDPQSEKEIRFSIEVDKTKDNWYVYECRDRENRTCTLAVSKYVDMGQQIVYSVNGTISKVFIVYLVFDEKLQQKDYRKIKFAEEMGRVLRYYKLYAAAIDYFYRAVSWGGHGRGLFTAMAQCFYELGKFAETINFTTKALVECPDSYCDRDDYLYNLRGLAKYCIKDLSYKNDFKLGGERGQEILNDISRAQFTPKLNVLKKEANFKLD